MSQAPAPLRKFRYEFPPMQARFVEAATPQLVLGYLQRKYPHNAAQVVSTLVEIPHWPAFWQTLDAEGRELIQRKARPLRDRAEVGDDDDDAIDRG